MSNPGDTHPLLSRLLRKVGASAAEVPPLASWRALLALVARTYQEADQDRYTLERSLDISSREIAVTDTGIGIAEADLPRLFQAFEQLVTPSGDRPPGTGLGLALTRRLVDMHGGSIEVESRLGSGTTFTVRLPAG